MISLDNGFELLGVQLYRDHADPTVFHYLPSSPRVASPDGLQLSRFRGEHLGGLLTLDVDLRWPDDRIESLRAALEERARRPATLAPVTFLEGTVRLTALATELASDTRDALVERIIGTAAPSLFGHQRAVFSIALEAEGVALVRAALTDAKAPLVVAYELAFAGLRPAREQSVRVRYTSAYEHLRARLSVDCLYASADLDRETEELRRAGLVEIVDVDFTGLDESALEARRREVEATARELVETVFFRPATSPLTLGADALTRDSAVDGAWARAGRPRALFALRALRQDESQTLDYDLRQSVVTRHRIAPQGPLRLPPGVTLTERLFDLDEKARLPRLIRAVCAPSVEWSGVASVLVDVKSADVVRTLALSQTQLEDSALVPQTALTRRVRLVRDAASDTGEGEAPWEPLDDDVIVVDPMALSGRRMIDIVAADFDPELVKRATVRVWQGDRCDDVTLDSAQSAARLAVSAKAPLRLDVTLSLEDHQTLTWTATPRDDEEVMVIRAPRERFVAVSVELIDPLSRYESVVVEMERALGAPRRALTLDREAPSARWWSPVEPGESRSFRYRVRGFTRDGGDAQGEWREASDSLLLVGDTNLRVERVTGVLAAPADHLGAIVSLTSLAPPEGVSAEVERSVDAGALEFQVDLPFALDAPLKFSARATVFLDGGELTAEIAEETSEVLILAFGP